MIFKLKFSFPIMPEKKILLVDYETQNLDYLEKLFEPHKFRIIKATDGLSAYDKFVSEKPNMIILEAMLPKCHGFDLTKKISQETKGKIPIIIITGLYRGPQYKKEALNYLGASDYFEKPVDKDKLIESVLNLLNKEGDIEEELPDPDSVIQNLSQRIKTQPKEPKKEEAPEQKKVAEPVRERLQRDDPVEEALSDIELDVMEEIKSLLREKKKSGEKR